MSENNFSEVEPNPERPQTEVKNRNKVKPLQLNATIDCINETHNSSQPT